MYFKDANPDIDTMVMYTDLRVPGTGEDFYRSGQQKGITFTKGQDVLRGSRRQRMQGQLQDLILNEDVAIEADLVVLATGMVANPAWTSTSRRKRSRRWKSSRFPSST
ncbi:MAG: hypothetical protein M5R42_08520 [Rhodocyclaceae bacterium]|nr:hypothetical protein [Rhodocyclaceae bacterium]